MSEKVVLRVFPTQQRANFWAAEFKEHVTAQIKYNNGRHAVEIVIPGVVRYLLRSMAAPIYMRGLSVDRVWIDECVDMTPEEEQYLVQRVH